MTKIIEMTMDGRLTLVWVFLAFFCVGFAIERLTKGRF